MNIFRLERLFVTLTALLAILKVNAYDFECDGIYYTIEYMPDEQNDWMLESKVTRAVTPITDPGKKGEIRHMVVSRGVMPYVGDVEIPASVKYQDKDYTVGGISSDAFRQSPGLISVTLPYTISRIPDDSFCECHLLETVNISADKNYYIGENAFLNCMRLSSINFGYDDSEVKEKQTRRKTTIYFSPISSLKARAFAGCVSLTEFAVPSGIRKIESEVFLGCEKLESVYFGSYWESIGHDVFKGCKGIKDVYVDYLKAIYDDVFEDYTYQHAELHVPEGRESSFKKLRGWKNFYEYKELTPSISSAKAFSVSLPGTLSNFIPETEKYAIEELKICGPLNGSDFKLIRAMAGCDYQGKLTDGKLKKLDLSDVNIVAGGEMYLDADFATYAPGMDVQAGHYTIKNSDELSNSIFMCSKIEEIILPRGITHIDENAFMFCTSISSISIPDGVTKIGANAFNGCQNLLTVHLPSSLMYIGRYAFANNPKLLSINLPNDLETLEDAVFYGCGSLAEICLPEGLLFIGNQAFENCSELSEITLPSSLLEIRRRAFYGCNKIGTITSLIDNPFPLDNAFDNYTAILYVPYGMKSEYEKLSGWNNYNEIVEMEPTKPILSLTEFEIDGDSIVGTVHTLTLTIKNDGTQYDGPLCVITFSENSNLYYGYEDMLSLESGKLATRQISFYFDEADTYYIWIALDRYGDQLLGEILINVEEAATLTANNFTREYGEENPIFSYTANKRGYNGEPQISCSADKYSPAGTYPIIITQGSVDNDYVTYENGTLTITKAPLTVTAASWYKRQATENPGFYAKYEGFKNGDTESGLKKKPEFSTDATLNSPIGDYVITPYGAMSDDYELSYKPGILTIVGKLGDVNRDGEANVTDVADVIQYVLGQPTNFVKFDTDVNGDNQVTIADATVVISIVQNYDYGEAYVKQYESVSVGNNELKLKQNGEDDKIYVELENTIPFIAFQFDVDVPVGTIISHAKLDDFRSCGHLLKIVHVSDTLYRIIGYSSTNEHLIGQTGVLVSFEVESKIVEELKLKNVHFADSQGIDYKLNDVGLSETTGIFSKNKNDKFDVYDLSGRLVKPHASAKDLNRGIYIINNKKVIIK